MEEKDFLLPIGATLQGGKYRVEAHLASGGFGNTYRITNVTFNEVFALKEFYLRGVNERDEATQKVSVSNAVNSEEFKLQKDKFHKEALRLRKLDNPHVVRVHDLFEENGTAYYVMDFLDGESLSAQMRKQGHPFTEHEVMDYTDQVLDALETIHGENIWHLDLKPGNIMTDRKGRAVLIDFGASKQFHDANGHSLSTSTGLCYTPGFAPTEQIESSTTKMGPWTDLYALGATMYNMLTMQTPPSVSDIQDGTGFNFPPTVSQQTQQIIRWMMEPNRNKRPQSVAEVRDFLASPVSTATKVADYVNHVAQQEPYSPTRPAASDDAATQIRRPMTPPKKSKTLWIVLGIVIALPILLVLLGLVGFVAEDLLNGGSSSRSSQQPTVLETLTEEDTSWKTDYHRLYMSGTLGGSNDAVLDFTAANGGTVTFSLDGVQFTRKVSFYSYDETTGRLVLSEYYTNGNYIGRFDGLLRNNIYQGKFNNEINGGSVDFYLKAR